MAKAMAKEPYQRFDTCREFALALSHGDQVWRMSTADTQFAANIPAPIHQQPEKFTTTGPTGPVASPSRRTALIAIGAAALLAVGIVAYVGASLGQRSPDSPPAATAPQPTSTWDEVKPTEPPPRTETVTRTATVEPPPPAPLPPRSPSRTVLPPSAPSGDLGLPVRISVPLCNGMGIVVLGNVTTPGRYVEGIAALLRLHPGASYLRTDQSCPSLRQRDEKGDPIYTVYRPAGYSQREVCAAVRSAGGDAYGKWLDYTTPPSYIIPC